MTNAMQCIERPGVLQGSHGSGVEIRDITGVLQGCYNLVKGVS